MSCQAKTSLVLSGSSFTCTETYTVKTFQALTNIVIGANVKQYFTCNYVDREALFCLHNKQHCVNSKANDVRWVWRSRCSVAGKFISGLHIPDSAQLGRTDLTSSGLWLAGHCFDLCMWPPATQENLILLHIQSKCPPESLKAAWLGLEKTVAPYKIIKLPSKWQ